MHSQLILQTAHKTSLYLALEGVLADLAAAPLAPGAAAAAAAVVPRQEGQQQHEQRDGHSEEHGPHLIAGSRPEPKRDAQDDGAEADDHDGDHAHGGPVLGRAGVQGREDAQGHQGEGDHQDEEQLQVDVGFAVVVGAGVGVVVVGAVAGGVEAVAHGVLVPEGAQVLELVGPVHGAVGDAVAKEVSARMNTLQG